MAEGELVRFENVDGIGVVTVDNPPVNALSPGVPEGIVENVERGNADPAIRAMVLIGAGAGLSFPSLMSLAMSGAGRDEAGLASGLVNTTLQVGGAIGLAVLATMSTERTSPESCNSSMIRCASR